MVLKVFFYGMLATLPAIFFETAVFKVFWEINFLSSFIFIFNIFFGVALVEEMLKFLVVKEKVLNNPEFDEPVDAIIYMIIAALGFAAGENILILFPLRSPFFSQILGQVLGVSILRFLGATFLHALSAAIVGFFIGLSFFEKEKRSRLIFFGLILATLLHGFYNLSIMKVEGNGKVLIPSTLLIISAVFISFGFQRLKKLALRIINQYEYTNFKK